MARISLGTTTTDETGKAEFDIPVGMGKQKVLTVLDEDTSVTSETEAIQSYVHDNAISSDYNDIFYVASWFTRNNSNTRCYYDNTDGSSTANYLDNNLEIPINNGCIIELEIDSITTNTGRLMVRRTEGSTKSWNNCKVTNARTVRIEVMQDNTYWYNNGNLFQTDTNKPNGTFAFAFMVNGGEIIDLTYKDFRIYPITPTTFTFADKGISTNYNDTGWGGGNRTVTRSEDYTTVAQTDSSSTSFYQRYISTPVWVEFDFLISNISNGHISIGQGSTVINQPSFSDLGVSANTWCHFQIGILEDTIYWNVNGSLVRTNSISTVPNVFLFRLVSGNTLQYKNFKIYDYYKGD